MTFGISRQRSASLRFVKFHCNARFNRHDLRVRTSNLRHANCAFSGNHGLFEEAVFHDLRVRGPVSGPIHPKRKNPRFYASPFPASNSGGRIRTSDLRVMSGIRSKSVTSGITGNELRPRDLRSRAVPFHIYHVDHVLRIVGYKVGYIFDRSIMTISWHGSAD